MMVLRGFESSEMTTSTSQGRPPDDLNAHVGAKGVSDCRFKFLEGPTRHLSKSVGKGAGCKNRFEVEYRRLPVAVPTHTLLVGLTARLNTHLAYCRGEE